MHQHVVLGLQRQHEVEGAGDAEAVAEFPFPAHPAVDADQEVEDDQLIGGRRSKAIHQWLLASQMG